MKDLKSPFPTTIIGFPVVVFNALLRSWTFCPVLLLFVLLDVDFHGLLSLHVCILDEGHTSFQIKMQICVYHFMVRNHDVGVITPPVAPQGASSCDALLKSRSRGVTKGTVESPFPSQDYTNPHNMDIRYSAVTNYFLGAQDFR